MTVASTKSALCLRLDKLLCGSGKLSHGMLERLYYEAASGNYAAAFSTAASPTQLYTIEGPDKQITQHTRERVLGIAQNLLAPGEDASYISHDGLRVRPGCIYPRWSLATPDHGRLFSISTAVLRARNGRILPGFRCR